MRTLEAFREAKKKKKWKIKIVEAYNFLWNHENSSFMEFVPKLWPNALLGALLSCEMFSSAKTITKHPQRHQIYSNQRHWLMKLPCSVELPTSSYGINDMTVEWCFHSSFWQAVWFYWGPIATAIWLDEYYNCVFHEKLVYFCCSIVSLLKLTLEPGFGSWICLFLLCNQISLVIVSLRWVSKSTCLIAQVRGSWFNTC